MQLPCGFAILPEKIYFPYYYEYIIFPLIAIYKDDCLKCRIFDTERPWRGRIRQYIYIALACFSNYALCPPIFPFRSMAVAPFSRFMPLSSAFFAVFALDGERRLLQLSLPLECSLLCPPAFLLSGVVGEQVKLLTPSRLGRVRFRNDVICHQIHAPDEQIRVDNAVEQHGRCVHELLCRRGQFSEALRTVCRFGQRAPVAIGLGPAVIVNPPCRIVQVINIVPDGQHKPVGDQALAHQIEYQLIRHFADNQTCLVRCIRTREHLPGADAVGARLVGF